ncbi:recombinase family protein [Komagataeibacter melomenusus]|uniref:recombinase family protein n=1 Tax=Komagataeibacter melomenusus TaxID=2766578 RepID=UPI001C2D5584|nr:recombinase family protein [Komagataeibacter melomenusus]MBV1829569.1 recombinase family protein [Komagataeibacter melomenusus]
MNYGYMRVSTTKRGQDGEYVQSFALQEDALTAAGIPEDRIFRDRMSGTRSDRPGLADLLSVVQAGDSVVVWKLDRLGRSARDLLNIAHDLKGKGVAIRSIQDGIDTSGSLGSFLLTILAAVAELEHENISERVKAGIASSRADGGCIGRKSKLSPAAKRDIIASNAAGSSITELSRRYRVGRTTIHRVISSGS